MKFSSIFVESSNNSTLTDSEPFLRLTPEKFIEKIEELKIPDLNQKDLLELARFLALSTPKDDIAAINLNSFLFYF